MVEYSIVKIAIHLTESCVLILCSAWITIISGIFIGVIFLILAGLAIVCINEHRANIEMERYRRENWGK